MNFENYVTLVLLCMTELIAAFASGEFTSIGTTGMDATLFL